MANDKKNLEKAKKRKTDEYYTQYEDIEKEMKHYIDFFENKIIYCNTDDMNSEFWKYFDNNFEKFKLKKLIATKYNKDKRGEKYELEIINNKRHYRQFFLESNGSFDSCECTKILEESDIIITNPPFSLFRDFIKTIRKHDKKFIVMGNQNAITYRDFFPLIKTGEVSLGVSIYSGYRIFEVPFNTIIESKNDVCEIKENKKYIKVSGVRWFTNLKVDSNIKTLKLTKKYNEKDYLKYDNYDAINVNKTKDIPYDYDGIMGVPITFLDKYNPKQFEIVGFRKGNDGKDLRINGKELYCRILIRKR